MGIRNKGLILVGLAAVLLGATVGCQTSLSGLGYFLMPEQRLPAKLKHLASEDRKVEPKVVILTHAQPASVSIDCLHADRRLAELLGRNLIDVSHAFEEKLSLLPQRRVEEFKNANPDWRQMGNATIGRKLGADYVIYLELNSMSLYEQGSSHELFRGRVNMLLELVDVSKPDEPPMAENYSCTFPSTQGPVPVAIDTTPQQFRQKFLEHVARQLTQYFSKYPRSEQRAVEPVF